MTAWQIAALRGILQAVGTGVLAGLAAWTQTNDLKTILIPSLTAAITVLIGRFGVEGAVDTAKG